MRHHHHDEKFYTLILPVSITIFLALSLRVLLVFLADPYHHEKSIELQTLMESNRNFKRSIDAEKNEKPINKTKKLSSFTYSQCPLLMEKFSQFKMARKSGTFESELDYKINSMHRAEKALEFSNNHHAYDTVVSALESGAFDNRTIVLDGDSLTRQLFISLSCLSWSAGFVEEYDIHAKVTTSNPVLKSSAYRYPSTFFSSGHVRLRGGIEIYYYDKQSESRIKSQTEEFLSNACNISDVKQEGEVSSKQKLRVNISKRTAGRNTIALNENDIFLVSAGHHDTRELYMNAYQKAFRCMESDRNSTRFKRWPHILYQTSSVSSFWTASGEYGENLLAGKEVNSCREYVTQSARRSEERAQLGNFTSISLIGSSLELEDLGGLHPWHKDCLHWIQPGIPDVYAAHLADYVMAIFESQLE